MADYFDNTQGLGEYFEIGLSESEWKAIESSGRYIDVYADWRASRADRERAVRRSTETYWQWLRTSTDDPGELAAIAQVAERYGR